MLLAYDSNLRTMPRISAGAIPSRAKNLQIPSRGEFTLILGLCNQPYLLYLVSLFRGLGAPRAAETALLGGSFRIVTLPREKWGSVLTTDLLQAARLAVAIGSGLRVYARLLSWGRARKIREFGALELCPSRRFLETLRPAFFP